MTAPPVAVGALAQDAYLVAVAAHLDPAGPAGWGAVVQRAAQVAEFQQHVCRGTAHDAVLDLGRAHVQALLHTANRPRGHNAVLYHLVKNEVWIIEMPASGAASIALYTRALVLAKRAALQPCAVVSVRFAR